MSSTGDVPRCGFCGGPIYGVHMCGTTPWYPLPSPQPLSPYPNFVPHLQGCICPVGAEKTCQGPLCPRRGITVTDHI